MNYCRITSEIKRGNFLLLLVVFTFSLSANSQTNDQVDATIQLYPTTVDSAEALSKFITRDFTSEAHKVRAIYTWLINNVSYDPAEYKNFDYSFKNYRERNKKEEKVRKKIIERTLQTGNAVCEGYAMVFEKLCQLQGIDNYLVRGDTKTNVDDIGRPFAKNHVWNVAFIDGEPYLFDATWGAGKFNDKFIKEPTYLYYKIEPSLLIKSHYPAFYEDAFLTETITKETFSNAPIFIKRDLKLTEDTMQQIGIIESREVDGALHFGIKEKYKEVAFSNGFKLQAINATFEDEVTRFFIPLSLEMRQLIIYLDGTPALAYKIK